MEEKRYERVLLGASVFSAGAWRPGDLIVDAGVTPAAEYSLAFRPGAGPCACATREGASFQQTLLRRGALSRQGVSPAALGPITARELMDRGAECRFLTRLVQVEEGGDGYRLTLAFQGTLYTVFARQVVDTTSAMALSPFVPGGFDPRPGAFIHAMARKTDGFREDPRFSPGAAEDDLLLTLPCREAEFSGDRERVCALAQEGIDGVRLTAAAVQPEWVPSVRGAAGRGWLWIPPVLFAGPDEAFDAGVRWAHGNAIPLQARVDLPLGPAAVTDHGRFDVIVTGLGTAGAVAACRAAGAGLRTLGIEALRIPGGTGTAGLVDSYYYGVPGGYYTGIDEEARGLSRRYTVFCPIAMSKELALSRRMRRLGVQPRYGASLVRVLREGNRIAGLMWMDDAGLHRAECGYLIDCTADSAAAVSACCEMLPVRPHFQPFSRTSLVDDGRLFWTSTDDGVVDSYDPKDYARAVLLCSSCTLHLWEDYAGSRRFCGLAPIMGMREGLRIVGEETVRFADLAEGRYTDKPIYHGYANLDNHAKDDALEGRAYRDFMTIASMWGYNLMIPVPAGALIPRGVEGMLAAGRGVSADHAAATALRMKPDAQKSGEAAAVLALLSLRLSCPAREVPYEPLRRALEETGCLTPVNPDLCMRQTLGSSRSEERIAPHWYTDVSEILTGLASQAPGFALWSAKRLKGDAGKRLEAALLRDTDAAPAYPLALALRGNPACAPALLRLMDDRSGRAPKNSWTFNHLYCVSAISAAGRLGLTEAVPRLLAIVTDPDSGLDIPMIHDGSGYEFMTGPEDVHYQLCTHAWVALREIARAHPEMEVPLPDPGALSVSQVTRRDLRLPFSPNAAELD